MGEEILFKCTGLTKRYSTTMGLDNFNLSIPSGKIIGLLGPNGSGKTTLIKLATGLLVPTAGTVTIDGMSPCVETKRIVSYLPERTYFNSWMRVSEILEFFREFYDDFNYEKATGLLARLGVSLDAKLKTLSKGTKERVQLVLVMSREAKLYLLDEPIAGVDPAARDLILDVIISNHNPGSTIIISTHLISDIERVLDEFVFIKNGSVIMHGGAEQTREKTGKTIDGLFREVFKC